MAFTYTANVNLVPTTSLRDLSEILTAAVVDPAPTLVFAGTGGVTSAVSAALLNFLSRWIITDVTPGVVSGIQGPLNAAVIGAAAASLAPGVTPAPTTLPPGVQLEVETAAITPAGISIWPALGAFGGVLVRVAGSPGPGPGPGGGGGGGTGCLSSLIPGLLPLVVRTTTLRNG